MTLVRSSEDICLYLGTSFSPEVGPARNVFLSIFFIFRSFPTSGISVLPVIAELVYGPLTSSAVPPFGPTIVVVLIPADFTVTLPVFVPPRVAVEETVRSLLTFRSAPATVIDAVPLLKAILLGLAVVLASIATLLIEVTFMFLSPSLLTSLFSTFSSS